jgi:hypothetical protein
VARFPGLIQGAEGGTECSAQNSSVPNAPNRFK